MRGVTLLLVAFQLCNSNQGNIIQREIEYSGDSSGSGADVNNDWEFSGSSASDSGPDDDWEFSGFSIPGENYHYSSHALTTGYVDNRTDSTTEAAEEKVYPKETKGINSDLMELLGNQTKRCNLFMDSAGNMEHFVIYC